MTENPLTELAYTRAEHARMAIIRRMRAVSCCLESAARLDQMAFRWSRLEAKLLRRVAKHDDLVTKHAACEASVPTPNSPAWLAYVASQRGGARHAENRRAEAVQANEHSRRCEANAARMRSTARKLEQHVRDQAAKLLKAFDDA